jgi:hypothetical protein
VIIGLHNYNKRPANNFSLSAATINLLKSATKELNNVTFIAFGNPYALKLVELGNNVFPIAAYEDDAVVHNLVFDMLVGNDGFTGRLPVTVSPQLPFGKGYNVGKKKVTARLLQAIRNRDWMAYNRLISLQTMLYEMVPPPEFQY